MVANSDSQAFDFSTLLSDGGQIRSGDGLIAFDARQIPDLQHLLPQEEASISFSIKLKDSWTIADSEKNNVNIKNMVDASGISQEFSNKVNSKLEILQTASSGQVTWQVKNYFNDVKNVKVKALLPAGATLSDSLSPESEAAHFSFDNQSRQIVWLAGDLSAGASATLTFQVTPDGSAPQLIGQATVSGEDQATGATIQSTAAAIGQ